MHALPLGDDVRIAADGGGEEPDAGGHGRRAHLGGGLGGDG
jgi:hypothetical protein